MPQRPTIGILLDYQADGTFSSRPHYALRASYFDALWNAGGTPVALPYIEKALDSYLDLCDGFVFPGGFYPFPARLYGHAAEPDETLHPRFRFEEQLIRQAVEQNQPVLGVCAGMQVLASLYGGTFYKDLKSEFDTSIDHLNQCPAEQTAHGVTITEGSHLHRVLGTRDLAVNTAHNEALKNRPDGLIVSAIAEDGVVEGIEVPGKRFCLGVQWHPEFFAREGDANFNLFTALVDAAGQNRTANTKEKN